MAGNQRKVAALAASKSRVQGVTGNQTVKATPGTLHRIVVANADVAVQTLTVVDGATTQVVLRVAAGGMAVVDFGVAFTTSIVVNPSSANIDALVLFD